MKTITLLAKIVFWYFIAWANIAQLEAIKLVAYNAAVVFGLTEMLLILIIITQFLNKGK
jgi:hypothetical protein